MKSDQDKNTSFDLNVSLYNAVLEEMDDGVVACDEKGNLVFFNRQAREWHGLDVRAVGQQEWAMAYSLYEADGITPLSPERIPLSRAFAGENVRDIHMVIRPDGREPLHLHASGGPLRGPDGGITGAVIVLHDITEHLRKINEIRERELSYRKLLEKIPDVVIETDMQGKILFLNDVLVRKGYVADHEHLLGHNIFEFVKEEDRDRAMLLFSGFTEKNPGTMEYRIVFPGGRIVNCDVKGNLVTDQQNQPSGIVFILRDLTILRKAETQVKMLAHTIRSVSECVSITDTADKIIFVNEAFAKTYGYTEEELIGQSMEIVRTNNNDPEYVSKILPETLRGGWQGELYNRRKDGSEFLIHLSTSVVRDENGEVICLVGICKDITDLKKAEQELNESRKRFQSYFDNTTVGICVTSPEKGWIDVNNHLCQMLGYSREELKSLTWTELTHPDDLQVDLELFEQVLKGKIDTYFLDKRFIRKDNSIVYTSLYVAAERYPDGSLQHILASLVDITSRKRAEEAIRSSEKKFRDITSFLPAIIYEADLNGYITFTNQAGLDTFGFSLEEIQNGINIFGLLDDEQKIRAGEVFKRIITEQVSSSGEYILRKKDGTGFHALIRSTPIENDGIVTGIRGAIIDISDQKKAEELRVAHEAAQALIQAQRHLSLLVDQSLVGFIELKTDLTVISWNPSAERIFGYSAEEAIGKTLPELVIPPAERKRIQENLDRVIRQKTGYRNINKNITRDGREIICEWHDTGLVDTDGQLLGIVSLVADITERIRAEEALTESREKLKQLAAYLQQAIEEERIQISRELHDSLGQSLTGLKMYAARLRAKILGNGEHDLSLLSESVDEMIGIMDSVMQQIRKIAKKLRPRVLDEAGLIPAIEAQLEEFRQQSGISYNFTSQTASISVNPKYQIEIYRIVQEALTNVVRHAKATHTEVKINGEDGYTRIDISDNGVGIREVNVMKLNTLGLLGMTERAAAFGGKIEFHGQPGEGTTVSLIIPDFKENL